MTMQTTNKVTILGVGISQTSLQNAVKTVENWLSSLSVIARPAKQAAAISNKENRLLRPPHRMVQGPRNDTSRPYFIATPNPEMLVLARQNKQFKQILNSADLAIPDGIGLIWASKFILSERIAGTDLMLALCKLAAKNGYTIGLLGGKEGVAEKTAEVLIKQFPGIKIKFAYTSLSLRGSAKNEYFGGDEAISLKSNEIATATLWPRNDRLRVDLLFVAFGAPKQEEWIWEQRNYSSNEVRSLKDSSRRVKRDSNNNRIHFKVAMGVGGAFDLISGKLKRAPKMWQSLGFEWLWRLIMEPKRLKRIFNATLVFPLLVLKSAIIKSWSHKNP